MSANGQIHSPGSNDWVEQLRETLGQEPPPSDEAVLDAAYDASEVDTATLFDYCEGRLSPEERQEVEAEVRASPHTLRKLTRIGAIVLENREGALASTGRRVPSLARNQNYQTTPTSPESSPQPSTPLPPAVLSRAKLPQPRAALGNSQPRPDDCVLLSPDADCEIYRSLEKNRDQLRIYHQSAPVGTLLKVRLSEVPIGSNPPSDDLTRFLVLRRGSDSSTATTLTIPLSFKRGELNVEVTQISHSELLEEDSTTLLRSYGKASEEDPIAVTPLHEPRSAWQLWADALLAVPSHEVSKTIRELAERIATS